MPVMSVSKMRAIVERLNVDYKKQVPEIVFFKHIMVEMDDASKRTVSDVCVAIHRLGFMKPTNIGVWEFTGEFAPPEDVKAAIAADDAALADRVV